MAEQTFTVEQDFPVSPQRLWSTLGRRDYTEQKYRALGSTGFRLITFDSTPDDIEVELERATPLAAEALPAWARSAAGKQLRLHQHSRWVRVGAARIDASLEVTPRRMPITARGVGNVLAHGRGRSRMTLHFTVTCNYPVVGAKVARIVAGEVEASIQADHAFTVEYLARHGRTGATR